MVGKIQYGQSGSAFLINQEGRTIAHTNKSIILERIQSAEIDATTGATLRVDGVSVPPFMLKKGRRRMMRYLRELNSR